MEKRIADLYRLPGIGDYEDVCLLTLSEECASLEARVLEVMARLSEQDRYVLESYMDMRNELEFQSVKTALRWGKLHYK